VVNLRRRSQLLALVLVVLFCAACPFPLGPVDQTLSLSAAELRPLLEGESRPIVVDTRCREEYESGHLPGALKVTLNQLEGYLANADISRDRTIVAVCALGHESLVAAALARTMGFRKAVSLEGGMEKLPSGFPLVQGPAPVEERLLRPRVLQAGTFEQVLVTITGLVIKPTYMLLSLVLVVILWRAPGRGLELVRRGLLLFFVGEAFCALNYIFTAGDCESLDIAHGLGMIGMGALVPWGLFLILDQEVPGLQDPDKPCPLLRLCRRCWKREQVPCYLRRLLRFAALVLAAVALLPLASPLVPSRPAVPVFGSTVIYAVDLPVQLLHFRLYPALGALLLAASAIALRNRGPISSRTQSLFFWGLGFTSFALFRFFLFQAYRTAPWWADAWEELTELLAVVAVAWGLYVFRDQLGLSRSSRADKRG